MRIEREVVSLSWIPSEAIGGSMKLPFEMGFTHYDDPPPDRIDDLDALRAQDRFRFANHLRAWIDIDGGGAVSAAGYAGGMIMGSTTVLAGRRAARTFEGFGLPTIQQQPEHVEGGVRFVQTTGGRTGLPAPRRVNRPPFVQWRAPLVWSTLALTIPTDPTAAATFEVTSTSAFPRHWIYGPDGNLAAKSGMTDFKDWYRRAFGKHSPWGDEESPALVAAAETALERRLSATIMRSGEKPEVRKVKEGARLMTEGEQGTEIHLLLDGIVRVEVGGDPVAEMGPGAVFGERASLEAGARTSTLIAVTPCRVAVARADQLDAGALAELAGEHRRESTPTT